MLVIETVGPVNGMVSLQSDIVLATDTELQFICNNELKNSVPNERTLHHCICTNKDKLLVANGTEIVQMHKQGDIDQYITTENVDIRSMDCHQDILIYSFGNTLKRMDLLKKEQKEISLDQIPVNTKISPNGQYVAVGDNSGLVTIFNAETLIKVDDYNTYLKYNIDSKDNFSIAWTPLNGLLIKGVGNIFYLDSHFKMQNEIEFTSMILDIAIFNNMIFVCTFGKVCCLDFKTHTLIKEYPVETPLSCYLSNNHLYVARSKGGLCYMSIEAHNATNSRTAVKPTMNEYMDIEAKVDFNETQEEETAKYQSMFNNDSDDPGENLDDLLAQDEQELRQDGKVSLETIKEAIKQIQSEQEPFQSGATPYIGTKRFMAYNLEGKVSKVKRDDGSFISATYHNKSKKSIRYADISNYEMADISKDGLYLCRAEEPYELTFYDPNRARAADWSIQLQHEPVALSAFTGGIAICTNKIHIFDSTGLCKSVFALEGSCLSICSFDFKIFALYVDALGNTCYQYVDTALTKLLLKGSLPTDKFIEFCTFSYLGNPVIYNEIGQLFMLSTGDLWIPVLDLSKNDTYLEYSIWPVGVSLNRFHYVPCPVFYTNVERSTVSLYPRCNAY